jgi:hypothetical protein
VLATTINNTFPFFLYAPEKFRKDLRERVKGINHYCRQGNLDMLDAEVKKINEMITDYDFGTTINNHIYFMQTAIKPLYESMEDLDRRLHEIEKQMKKRNKTTSKKSKPRLDTDNTQSNAATTKIPFPLTNEFIEGIESNEKPVSVRHGTLDYLKMRSPDFVTADEIAGYLGVESRYVANEITRLKLSDKYVDEMKHIVTIESFRKSPTSRQRKAYKWINEITESTAVECSENDSVLLLPEGSSVLPILDENIE